MGHRGKISSEWEGIVGDYLSWRSNCMIENVLLGNLILEVREREKER